MHLDTKLANDPQSDDDFAGEVEFAMDNRGENWKARVALTKIPNAQRRVI